MEEIAYLALSHPMVEEVGEIQQAQEVQEVVAAVAPGCPRRAVQVTHQAQTRRKEVMAAQGRRVMALAGMAVVVVALGRWGKRAPTVKRDLEEMVLPPVLQAVLSLTLAVVVAVDISGLMLPGVLVAVETEHLLAAEL
jgi:hypothetical protein